jgi:hypothetical protein
MEPLRTTAAQVLRTLLEAQPNTSAKIGFAWKIAAGPAMSRASRLDWAENGTLTVHAASENWRREVQRARPTLAARLDHLLGAGVVRRIVVARSQM